MKVEKDYYDIDVEETLKGKVKKFGSNSAHIIVPKKWIGHEATVLIEEEVLDKMGMFGGYIKKYPKKFGHLKKEAEKHYREWKKQEARKKSRKK